MTAYEVMTWIGLGEALDFREYDLRVSLFERWGPNIEDDAVLALDARAAAAPSCAVVHQREVDGPIIGYRSRWLSPAGPQALRHLRAWHRRYSGRLVTYAEMANQLRDDMRRSASDERAVAAGQRALLAELQRGSLTAQGRLVEADGKLAAVPTAIPVNFWANRWHAIGLGDATALAVGAPIGEMLVHGRPEWRELQFATEDVLAMWPPQMPTAAPSPAIEAPAYLTWFQALTWIATGGEVVPPQDIHPDLIWRRPVSLDGDPAPLPPPYIMTPEDAQRTLVRSLALGELDCVAVQGPESPANPDGPGEVVPVLRWAHLHPDRGIRVSEVGRVTYVWASPACCYWRPMLPTLDVVRLWPPVRTPQAEAQPIYSTGAPGRPTSRALVLAEMQRRFEQGLGELTLAAEARALSDWLQRTHPEAPQMKPRALENAIRDEHRRARAGSDAIK